MSYLSLILNVCCVANTSLARWFSSGQVKFVRTSLGVFANYTLQSLPSIVCFQIFETYGLSSNVDLHWGMLLGIPASGWIPDFSPDHQCHSDQVDVFMYTLNMKDLLSKHTTTLEIHLSETKQTFHINYNRALCNTANILHSWSVLNQALEQQKSFERLKVYESFNFITTLDYVNIFLRKGEYYFCGFLDTFHWWEWLSLPDSSFVIHSLG